MRKVLLTISLIWMIHAGYCQEPVLEEAIEQLTVKTEAEKNLSDADYSDFIDEISQYLRHPVNINDATEQELKQLQLNDIQANNIKRYIEQYGELTGIYELNLVEGFDSTLIRKLEPYISFKINTEIYKLTLQNLVTRGDHRILTRYQRTLQQQQGYSSSQADSLIPFNPNAKYLGSQDKVLFKYRYTFYNRLSFGITMEKDAGETLVPKSDSLQKGFDFYSLHFFYKGKGLIKNLALGDYHVQFGQGLTIHSSFGFSKNPSATVLNRGVNQVKASTGANESQFLRGVAVTLAPLSLFDLTLFYSSRLVDANALLIDTTSNEILTINSLTETGLHRTPAELANKKSVKQIVYGSNLQTRYKIFRFGATAFRTQLSADINTKALPYNQFDFRGNSLTNFGTDVSLIYHSLVIYSELSGSSNGAKAYLAGVSYQPDALFGLSLLYRNYDKDYQNLFSNAFAESSKNANEKGLYLGMFAILNSTLTFSAYADYYQFDWLKYRVDAPSVGVEYMAQLFFDIPYTDIILRYHFRKKEMNYALANPYIDYPESEAKHNLRLHIVCHPTPLLTFKSRLEFIKTIKPDNQSNTGFLVYQDLIYTPEKKPWLINLRYALFDTETYDERIYAYESDVLYSFSIPSYYYRGSRFYIMTKYSFNRSIDLWIRYSRSFYSNQNQLGSGLETIDGNVKSEVKVQLLLKL